MAHLLLVEDNDLVVLLLKQLLEERYDIAVAGNGREGIEQVKQQRPDLILMDLTMPVMDGWTAIAALRADAETANIPIIALSARVDPSDVRRALAVGADAHVAKPFDEDELLDTIAGLLAKAPRTGVRVRRDEVATLVRVHKRG